MLCKDCLHFDVCKDATIPNPDYKGPQADKSKECRHFIKTQEKGKAGLYVMARYIDADRLINEISGNGGVFVFFLL